LRAGAWLAPGSRVPLLPLVPALVMALPSDGLDGTPTVPLPYVGDGPDWDADLSAGGEAGTALQGGELGADAYVQAGDTDRWNGQIVGYAAATGGSVDLRGGSRDVPRLGGEHWARLVFEPFFATPDSGMPGGGLFSTEAEHRLDIGALPALTGRKDGLRGAFGREELGFTTRGLSVYGRETRVDFAEIGFGNAWTWQDGVPLHDQMGFHAVFVRECHERGDELPERCVEVMPFQALGVEGGSSAAIGTVEPVRLGGVHVVGPVYADLSGGFGGTGVISEDTNGQAHTIATADLPDIGVGTYDLRAFTADGGFDARAHRTIYLTLDGDLAVEDRAEAAVAFGERTRVTLRGFAARTAWWTSKTDPGTAAVTGGGELDVARTDRGLAWNASLGVARSFYATLDGAAADAPALGARGSLEVRRALRKRRTASLTDRE
jgi:hypothetical protein